MKWRNDGVYVLALFFVAIGLAFAVMAQPNTAPNWPFRAPSGDVQRQLEYDKNGDHSAINLKLLSGTPTPGPKDGRCSVVCAGATPSLQQSVDGGPYEPIGSGGGGGCACPGAGTESWASGTNAAAAGNEGAAGGYNANASGASSTALGHDSEALALGAVAVGEDATAANSGSIAIGRASGVAGNNTVCIGAGSLCLGADGVAIGQAASGSGDGVCLGTGCTSDADQFVVGSASHPTTSVTFGAGFAVGAPQAYTLSGNTASGANTNGGALAIGGGAGTGTGVGGNLALRFCPAGSSGTSLNGCATAWSMSGNTGALLGRSDQPIVLDDALSTSIYFNSTADEITVSSKHYTIGGAITSLFNVWTNSTFLDQAVNAIIIQNNDIDLAGDGSQIAALGLLGTVNMADDNQGTVVFYNGWTATNDPAENRAFGTFASYQDSPTYLCQGSGRTCTSSLGISYRSSPTYSTSGGATFNAGAHTHFSAGLEVGANVQLGGQNAYTCPALTGAGSITGHNSCFDAERQTLRGATGTWGFRNADASVYSPLTQTITDASNVVWPNNNTTNLRIANDTGSSITLTSTPTIDFPPNEMDGAMLFVQNMGADDVVFQDADVLPFSGLQLISNTNKTLGYLDSVWFTYNLAAGAWIQASAVNDI